MEIITSKTISYIEFFNLKRYSMSTISYVMVRRTLKLNPLYIKEIIKTDDENIIDTTHEVNEALDFINTDNGFKINNLYGLSQIGFKMEQK